MTRSVPPGAVGTGAVPRPEVRGRCEVGPVQTARGTQDLELAAAGGGDLPDRRGHPPRIIERDPRGSRNLQGCGATDHDQPPARAPDPVGHAGGEGLVPEGVAHRVLAEEALIAAVPEDHPLAGRDTIDLAELAEEPFADFAAGGPGRAQSDRAFRAAGLVRQVPFEASTAELIGALVTAGLAVALLPAPFAPARGARSLAVRDGPRRTEFLIWNSFRPSPAATAALRLVA